jgi:hypothetical protein
MRHASSGQSEQGPDIRAVGRDRRGCGRNPHHLEFRQARSPPFEPSAEATDPITPFRMRKEAFSLDLSNQAPSRLSALKYIVTRSSSLIGSGQIPMAAACVPEVCLYGSLAHLG